MRLFLCLVLSLGFSISAYAEPTSAVGTVTMIRTGWNLESFAIVLDNTTQNPAHCSYADGYVTDGAQPGYKTYYAAALVAFIEKVRVEVVFDGCHPLGRPKIIGINLQR